MVVAALAEAIQLLVTRDTTLYQIIIRSLRVSLTAVFYATALAIPLAFLLGRYQYAMACGRYRGLSVGLVTRLIYAFMGLPPVVAGLVAFLIASPRLPLGRDAFLTWSPEAMILAQLILAMPLVLGWMLLTIERQGGPILDAALGLGANEWQAWLTLAWELRWSLLLGILAALSRLLGEVGAVLLVGNNIPGVTQVITATILQETRKGNLGLVFALAMVLLALSIPLHLILTTWGLRRDRTC